MVGAIIDPRTGELSQVDMSLLRAGIDPLRNTGLPVAPDEELEVEVMNKADLYGHRDFLQEEGVEADIVILCNIPHLIDEAEYTSSMVALKSNLSVGFDLIANHELSDHHWDRGIWARKLAETGAPVIISYGVDSMPLDQVTPSGYFHARQVARMPSSGEYIMNAKFVHDLPFSQWLTDNEPLKRFVMDSQWSDIPFEPDPPDTGQHHD